MTRLFIKDLPRYECLLQASARYPTLDPSATEAFLNLLRTSDDLFAVKNRFLALHDMSPGRFNVLMLLNRHPEQPSTPATLAEQSAVTRATMTGLLDTLEKDGLILRQTDPLDRRTIQVRLTGPGHDLLEATLPDYFAELAILMQPLNESERKALVALLQKISQALAAKTAGALPSPASAAA